MVYKQSDVMPADVPDLLVDGVNAEQLSPSQAQ